MSSQDVSDNNTDALVADDIVETDTFVATIAYWFFWVTGFALSPVQLTGGFIGFGWWACLLDVLLFPLPGWYTGINQWVSCIFHPMLRIAYDGWVWGPAILEQMQIVFLAEAGAGEGEDRGDPIADISAEAE